MAGSVAMAGLAAAGLWFVSTHECMASQSDTASSGESSGVRFDGQTYTNRLIHSHDPYLLLHAHNPVDWYPWGPDALAKAKRENKPIFVSVGYSTCFWCHVAEREIYSDPQIAELMNQWFVNVKVDREERPDVDRIYMLATQVMTGRGGWPNNVFLTPDLKPFFAGSYFPSKDTGGRPGFPTILRSLHQAWNEDQAKVLAVGERVYQTLQQIENRSRVAGGGPLAPRQWLDAGVRQASSRFDAVHAGFSGGGPTKFPQEPLLSLLLAAHTQGHEGKALPMASAALQAMAEGGVMDQLGGGFHRYSTEPSWSVPHFEKMLYNNAQLLNLYAQAYTITRKPLFRQIALRTAQYLSAEMRAPDGGFYSAQDAEVDGAEGASYVWTQAQIESVLGATGSKRWFALYTLVPMPPPAAGQKHVSGGVLRLDRAKADALLKKNALADAVTKLAPLRDKLLAARNQRAQPARDEKIVVADNALAILGFVQAGQALDKAELIQTASATATWLWTQAFAPGSGTLRHQFFRGHAGGDAFLDDYALLGRAFLALHAATGDAAWKTRAQQLAEAILERFVRPDGSLTTISDATGLLIAPPTEGDSTQPSGPSAAVALLLELSASTGEDRYALAAWRALSPLSAPLTAQPSNWGALLAALASPSLTATLERAQERGAQLAQRLPSSADYVHAVARMAPAAGGFDLVVALDIDAGYHINANPASDPDLVPTQLLLAGHENVRVAYPPTERFVAPFAPQGIAVYTGRVQLRAHLPRTPAAPSTARLRVQACNDEVCLAPATIEVPLQPFAAKDRP